MNTTETTTTNSDMFTERLKFYADTPMAKNKYFCWKLDSILTLKEAIWRFFDKGWNIRSAWYEKINLTTGEVEENTKLNIQEQLEEYTKFKLKEHNLSKIERQRAIEFLKGKQ